MSLFGSPITTTSLNVKIGEHEFNATGPTMQIFREYVLWLSAVEQTTPMWQTTYSDRPQDEKE